MKYIKKKPKRIDLKIYYVFTSGTNKSTSTYVRITLAKIFNVFSKLGQMPDNRKSAAQHTFQKVY